MRGWRAIKQAAIVAGGQGARMGAGFADVPKALISVGGKPVLQHQLELAARSGVEEVVIFAGHLADQIDAFVGDGRRFGLSVRVEVETEPLGNAGMMAQRLDWLDEHFFVLYGDVMLAVDLCRVGAWHLEHRADFTTLAHPNDHPHDSDLLETDDDSSVLKVHAAPHPDGRHYSNLVNAALYVVRREALRPWAACSKKLDFTRDILTGLVDASAHVLAYRTDEYIKDMGTPQRLERVKSDWADGKIVPTERRTRGAAVFLDRDGVLNREVGHLARAEQLDLLPGVGAALRRLRQAGFALIVVTNQPVIARGEASESDVADVHRKLEWELGKQGAYLDAIYLCPHHPDAGFPGERPELKVICKCRKPATGLVDRACRELGIDAAASWMVGDHARDIELAHKAGMRSILVRTDAGGNHGPFAVTPDHEASGLSEAANTILGALKRPAA